MPSRRVFLRTGLTASVLPWVLPRQASPSTLSVSPAMPDVYRVYKVVSDVRFAPAVEFAREADRLGAGTVRIDGDITEFWYADLSRQWRHTPRVIAGLTAHGPLFCLERWAWDHGLRVVFRGEHRAASPGGIEHALTGPPATIADARAAAAEGGAWSRRVARLVTACAAGPCVPAHVTMAEAAHGAFDALPEPLFSWVIARPTRT